MSDFEYDYNSNSNDDNISYDYSISDTNYSDDEVNSKSNKYNFIIDMDEDENNEIKEKAKQKSSIINNIKPFTNNFDSLFNNEETGETVEKSFEESTKQNKKKTNKIQLKKKEYKIENKIIEDKVIKVKVIKEKTIEEKTIKQDDKTIEDKTIEAKINKQDDKKEVKLTKKEQNFEFNEETIEFYTKSLEFKKILIKRSNFTNDIQVICLLLKHKIISDYCCSIDKCKVKNLWINNPIQLILHRKNNIQNDLSSFNLELICGNCYLSKYGLDIFKKKEKEIIFKCDTCGFPLVKFNNTRKKKGICLSCEKKMNNVFNENIDSKFYSKIQDLYNDNPLLSEENKESNYYKNSGKSKYSSTYKKQSDYMPYQNSQENKSKNNQPIVSLNLTLPKIDDLLN